MANPEHVEIVKQGKAAIAEWRKMNPSVQLDLSDADLIGANLRSADLNGAKLSDAGLSGADLKLARFGYSAIGNCDLRGVLGLEETRHDGPSSIGIDTLYKSKGDIPETFLRGCGVPDNMIDFMRSLTRDAFDFYSCFISYSSEDTVFARRLYDALQGIKQQLFCKFSGLRFLGFSFGKRGISFFQFPIRH